MGLLGKIYHPTPRNTTIQAVLDPDAEFVEGGRQWKLALFNADGTPTGVDGAIGPTGPEGPQGDIGPQGPGVVGVYRTLREAYGRINTAMPPDVYFLGPDGADWRAATGTGQNSVGYWLYYFDPADYEIDGLETKLRIRGWLITNATAPEASFQFGMYSITNLADGMTSTNHPADPAAISLVPDSQTAQIVTPAAEQMVAPVSVEFDPPAAAGFYLVGVDVDTTGASTVGVPIVFYQLHVVNVAP